LFDGMDGVFPVAVDPVGLGQCFQQDIVFACRGCVCPLCELQSQVRVAKAQGVPSESRPGCKIKFRCGASVWSAVWLEDRHAGAGRAQGLFPATQLTLKAELRWPAGRPGRCGVRLLESCAEHLFEDRASGEIGSQRLGGAPRIVFDDAKVADIYLLRAKI